tara:strand:+ start:269 stop:886 length:618 start_codon:yes stop_codon:yes gene_type:complete
MEYYIHNIPVFILSPVPESVDIPAFCQEVEDVLPAPLIQNVEVVYIGDFKELDGRNAAFTNGAIYITANEPTNFDMLENFVHEVAHSLESARGGEIYDDNLINEFLGKRKRLRSILEAEGFEINPLLYDMTEYNKKFDEFLSDVVGYPTLLNLTMGLFVSPYGATSMQEYFANGFEKYFLDSPRLVRDISPALYQKIDSILNDNT